jgi:alpha-galactosidase
VVITNAYGAVTSSVVGLVVQTNAVNNFFIPRGSLALTPPMGWNDWYTFRCSVSEAVVEGTADAIAGNGMKAAGYQYVNIDDCWQISRNSNGVILADPTKFPDGMTALAAYVHSDGLKFGLYTAHGVLTCQLKPGSYGYEYLDAFTYAGWNIDFLKDDACTLPAGDNALSDYFRMSDGLVKSGRPIVFSLCEAGNGYEYWSPSVGNCWRTTQDTTTTFTNVMSHVDPNSLSAYAAGPGHWNDADILQVGLGDFTSLIPAETHFTMWCIMASPLLAGNDVTSMSTQTLSVLTNAEAIAVDQDPAGEQATWAGGIQDNAEVWSKPLGYDFSTRAVALLNRSLTSSANITCTWTNLGLLAGTATVRDLWGHTNLGTFTNSFTTNVPAEGVVFLKIVGTPVPPPAPGTNYLSTLQPIYAYVSSNGVWVNAAKNKNIAGQTMKLNGGSYTSGVGVTTTSGLEYNLGGNALRFQSDIGVDDQEGANGSVVFQVFADGTKIYDSGIMVGGGVKQFVNLDVTGVRRLTLGVCDTINNSTGNRGTVSTANYADWANALLVVTNAAQPPETPTGLAATPGNAITLKWNPTLAALSYNVKRATVTGGPYTTITNVPIATFTDSNVVSGTPYYYVVSAVSSLGESSNSLEATAEPCNVPLAPTNVVATGSYSEINLRWNASAGATSYNVYRFTFTTPPVLVGANIMATNFTDTQLGAGVVTNYYLLTAANACNQSGWSTPAAGVTTSIAVPEPISLLKAGNGQLQLNWSIGTLQSSTNVMGPYQNLPYTSPPIIVPTTNAQQFYRVMEN